MNVLRLFLDLLLPAAVRSRCRRCCHRKECRIEKAGRWGLLAGKKVIVLGTKAEDARLVKLVIQIHLRALNRSSDMEVVVSFSQLRSSLQAKLLRVNKPVGLSPKVKPPATPMP